MKALVVVAFATVLGLFPACGSSHKAPPPPAADYPDQGLFAQDFGWPVTIPEAEGVSSAGLHKALDYIDDRDLAVHAVIVARQGKIVLDASIFPYRAYDRHDIASITKTITGILVGQAIATTPGLTTDATLLSLLPQYSPANPSPEKDAIRMHDLLTMRSGLGCSSDLVLLDMFASPDWAAFTLDLPMAYAPSEKFQYCSSASHLLSAILTETLGENAAHFAESKLWKPLGIESATWPADEQGRDSRGWGDLQMTPYDLAKIGQLYLQDGRWKGRRLVESPWIAASTQSYGETEIDHRFSGYGYLWWIGDEGYMGIGRGGQRLAVLPDLDMVVVVVAAEDERGQAGIDTLVLDHIAKSAINAPKNDLEAYGRLTEKVSALRQQAEPPAFETGTSTLAATVSGRQYRLAENVLRLETFSLRMNGDKTALVSLALPDGMPLELLVGLDGRPRYSPGRYGIPGSAVGYWSSDNTFEFEVDEIGLINRWNIRAKFSDDAQKVSLFLLEHTGMPPTSAEGTAE